MSTTVANKPGLSNFVDVTAPGKYLYGTPTPELVAEAAISCRMADPNTLDGSKVLMENCLVQKMLDAEYPEYAHLVAQDIVHRIRRDAKPGTPTSRWRLDLWGRKLNRAFDDNLYASIGKTFGQRLRLCKPMNPSQTREGKLTANRRARKGLAKKQGTRKRTREQGARNLAGVRLAEWLTQTLGQPKK